LRFQHGRTAPWRSSLTSFRAIACISSQDRPSWTLNVRDFLLGPYRSRGSKSKYDRLVAEWLANDRRPFSTEQDGLTVGELVSRYYRFAKRSKLESIVGGSDDHRPGSIPQEWTRLDPETAAMVGPPPGVTLAEAERRNWGELQAVVESVPAGRS
jgi:hypothetical protein